MNTGLYVDPALETPPAPEASVDVAAVGRPLHVLTIDLEEWFHVTNFSNCLTREDWERCPTRVQETVPRLLDLLAEYQARATFFTLGWVAQRFPKLVRRIAEAGHELASHGDEHQLVTRQTPSEFRAQLVRSKEVIEQAGSQPVLGHRAPSYSFRKTTDWAIPVLLESGFEFDSSVFPFGPRRDPELCDSREPCLLNGSGAGALVEYPLSIFKLAGCNVPIAGGGYFRLLPYPFVQWGMKQLEGEGRRIITYFHPWEIDPDQPRVEQASPLAKFRHYYQLDRTEQKLGQLLADFRFGSIRDVFWSPFTRRYELTPQQ